ncbi:MAG: FAD-dependent oxidoreductase, partial [Desulfobacteraceae bacterium]
MAMHRETDKIGAVLVVGAGVAGMQAALDLANSGYYVYLTDRSPTIGGIMAQLDKTFPTNDCSMCIISPKLVEVGRHLNIEVLPDTEVEALEGELGHFRATLNSRPRYIDPVKCTGCGDCRKVCPVTAVNEFNAGLDRREATYIRYPQAVPLAFAIDRQVCIGCGLCGQVCLAGAVKYHDTPHKRELDVGGVILTVGSEVFDPSRLDNYNYAQLPNVVTSLEFERILSASGPYRGHLMRPYDREEPQKIAWLQCVGSRDVKTNPYCSAVCCMYAIKEAVIAKEHAHGDLDTAIFYMDMRTYGKDFEQYYNRARHEHGVRFIRSRIHSIDPEGECDLRVSYVDDQGEKQSEVFDLVVLSVGFQVSESVKHLARRLGIGLNQHNFALTDPFVPVATSRPGVYVCGTFQCPKDIPQSVMEASAAAAACSAALGEARWTRTKSKEVPPERMVSEEEPRIGVFVCNCGINIGGIVNVPAVREYARTLPNVVHVEDNLYTCSQDTQVKISSVIKEHDLNRVVVAACTPLTHEPMFQETLIDVGLNKYLFEMANIRNQDSWVHMKEPDKATAKAKDLVRMAVARASLLRPLFEKPLDITQRALVIGGGIAGLTAALNLADQGFETIIIEKEKELGGNARHLGRTIEGQDVPKFVNRLVEKVENHEKIQVLTQALVVGFRGYKGNFTTEVIVGPGMYERKINHGATIVATGAQEYRPKEFLYGEHDHVMTLLELGQKVSQRYEVAKWDRVAMIQCVGSRNAENPNCSRICCQGAVKYALELKDINPDLDVVILYRDMRMYGFLEDYYLKARNQGIMFARYDLDNLPQVQSEDGKLSVTFNDHILNRPIRMPVDAVVLSAGIRAADTEELASLLKIPRSADGFFIEAHAKLRPVDFASEGIFLCGMAHSPKLISESI